MVDDPNKDEEVKILDPDYALKEKTGGADIAKVISPEKVKKAEGIVESSKSDLQEEIYNDILKLEKVLETIHEVEDQKEILEQFTDTALNIKSDAGMAGYILATEFSKSLYQFSRELDELNEKDKKIIKAHIDALKNIFKHKKDNAGDQVDRELLKALTSYTEKRKQTLI